MQAFPNDELIAKYNHPVPRYTSYPPANFFHDQLAQNTPDNLIYASNTALPDAISLYIHVPFCPQICHFCACNSCTIPAKTHVEHYFKAVNHELLNLAKKLDNHRPVKQVHWGGGTPNGVALHYLKEIMELIFEHFSVATNAEIAVEAHPGYLDMKQLEQLKAMGFTRLSLGVQDIHPRILNTLHRREPKLPLMELIPAIHQAGFRSLNVDLVYGLPGQSADDFLTSVEHISTLKPDRIVTFSYAHVPWVKGTQNKLDKVYRIEGNEKLRLFTKGKDILHNQGYTALGLDHFALPQDPLVKAYEQKQLHRNFMGYALKEQTGQVYGVGASAISQLSDGYLQTHRDYQSYTKAIIEKGTAYIRGYKLNEEEKLVRAVVTQVMCNGELNWENMARETKTSPDRLREVTRFEEDKLISFEQEGLIVNSTNGFSLTPQGWFFVRNIASLFDPLYQQTTKHYSKSI
ncbi:MAG: oxygen-independent coproporphyrinogen III oxidase [Bacteroidota bacterium]